MMRTSHVTGGYHDRICERCDNSMARVKTPTGWIHAACRNEAELNALRLKDLDRKRGRTWQHTCEDCGIVWSSGHYKSKVCRACSIKRALAGTAAKPKISATYLPPPPSSKQRTVIRSRDRANNPRQHEDRKCERCAEPWRVRIEAKSRMCRPCAIQTAIETKQKKRALIADQLKAKFWTERPCRTCGRVFEIRKCKIPPWNKTTNSKGNYCSVPCSAEGRRKGFMMVPPKRGEARQRWT